MKETQSKDEYSIRVRETGMQGSEMLQQQFKLNPPFGENKRLKIAVMKKVKIEIELSVPMVAICKALGIEPKDFFNKVQDDLIGDSTRLVEDDRMLLHLYVAQSVATKNKVDRSKVEDLLDHLSKLKTAYERNEYTYLVNDLFMFHENFCNHCEKLEFKK